MKNADENELRSIASDPDEIHMYNVNDFQFLLTIVDELTVNLCNSVKGSGREWVTGSIVIKLTSLVVILLQVWKGQLIWKHFEIRSISFDKNIAFIWTLTRIQTFLQVLCNNKLYKPHIAIISVVL